MPPLSLVTRSRSRCCGCSTVHGVGFTWAWSIIVLTFIVRLALVPLTVKQQQSMRRMTALQPELKKLQAKYKHDRQMLNEKMMEFYGRTTRTRSGRACRSWCRSRSSSACSTCCAAPAVHPARRRPVVPVRLHRGHHDAPEGPADVDARDPDGDLRQLAGRVDAADAVHRRPAQKYLFAGMPILFAVFIMNQAFPAGLMLYWITTNLWTCAQAGVIRHVFPPPGVRRDAGAGEGEEERRPAPRRPSARPSRPPKPAAPKPAATKPKPQSRRGRRSRAARAAAEAATQAERSDR